MITERTEGAALSLYGTYTKDRPPALVCDMDAHDGALLLSPAPETRQWSGGLHKGGWGTVWHGVQCHDICMTRRGGGEGDGSPGDQLLTIEFTAARNRMSTKITGRELNGQVAMSTLGSGRACSRRLSSPTVHRGTGQKPMTQNHCRAALIAWAVYQWRSCALWARSRGWLRLRGRGGGGEFPSQTDQTRGVPL